MARKVNTTNSFRMPIVRVMMGYWMREGRGAIARSRMGGMVDEFVSMIGTMGEIRFTSWAFKFSWSTIA